VQKGRCKNTRRRSRKKSEPKLRGRKKKKDDFVESVSGNIEVWQKDTSSSTLLIHDAVSAFTATGRRGNHESGMSDEGKRKKKLRSVEQVEIFHSTYRIASRGLISFSWPHSEEERTRLEKSSIFQSRLCFSLYANDAYLRRCRSFWNNG
jgi:hypothetical protein